MSIQKSIYDVLRYFAFFSYAPTIDEIHTFLPVKISKGHLDQILKKLAKAKKINVVKIASSRLSASFRIARTIINRTSTQFNRLTAKYTLQGHSISDKVQIVKIKNSVKKVKNVKRFIQLLSFFPHIKLVGISGSLAMFNAKRNDDVDFFIITERNRLWTGRFLALVFAELFGMRRRYGEKHTNDKICLNLFFDERELIIPSYKQNLYVGHEILQMKPIIDKENTYGRFLKQNKWIHRFFPNSRFWTRLRLARMTPLWSFWGAKTGTVLYLSKRLQNRTVFIGNIVEAFLKKIQLWFINKHKTTEIITETQLWFFPDDFEKKIASIAGQKE